MMVKNASWVLLFVFTHMVYRFAVHASTAFPYALVVIPSAPAGRVVVLGVDFAQVARALRLQTWHQKVVAENVYAALDSDPNRLLPCQYDPRTSVSGELTLLPPASETEQRVRVYFTEKRPSQLLIPGSLQVVREGDRITINNGFVAVTFDPKTQAGLPSRWEFPATGKVFTDFNNNDAVFAPSIGRLHLRSCPHPQVQLTAAGPMRACVRVSSQYSSPEGHALPGGPEAVYEYHFFAGCPYIRLAADVQQKKVIAWTELHVIEINFPKQDFTHWTTGKEVTAFKADNRSYHGGKYAALLDGPDGPNVLGVLGFSIIHDGHGAYGTYVHGPWVPWSSAQVHIETGIYAGCDADALTRLKESPRAPAALPARVSTPGFEDSLNILKRGRGPDGKRWRWVAVLLEATGQKDLALASDMAARATAAMHNKTNPTTWLVRNFPDQIFLDNGTLAMAWQVAPDRTPEWRSLFDLTAGRELLSSRRLPLWSIQMEDAEGKSAEVSAATPVTSVRTNPKLNTLIMEWRPLRVCDSAPAPERDKMAVRMTAHLQSKGALQLSLEIDNDSSFTLAHVTWPQIVVGPFSKLSSEDVFIGPLASGKMWVNPYVTFPGIHGSLYPNGWLDIPIFIAYGSQNGIVMMAQDPLASSKYLEASAEPGAEALRLAFRWLVADHTRAGNDFSPPGRIEVAALKAGQDWYDAAMLYRAWAAREAKWWPQRGKEGRPDTPRWMLDLPVWALTGGAPKDCVAAVKAFREYLGVPCGFHWYNWHEIPFDVHYPRYFPTKPGFAEGVKELQQAGVRVMPYINGRLWDTGNNDFQSKAFPAAAKQRDGTNYIEEYGSRAKLAPMCPTTRLWQETVQGIVKRLVGPEFGVDGVYIDQVAAAGPAPCYDPSHGHPLGGGNWWTVDGYWPMLENLRADLAREFPDKMLTTECTAEPYLHCFDGYLTWHWQEENAVPLFSAIYHDKIRLFSRAYNASGNVALVRRMKVAQQLVFGEQLGWLDPHLIRDEKFAPYLRAAAQTRYRLRDCLRGQMLRPPVMQGDVEKITGDWQWGGERMVTLAAVQAGAFRRKDGRVAVVITNFSDNPQSCDLILHVQQWKVKGDAKTHIRLEPQEVRAIELEPIAQRH